MTARLRLPNLADLGGVVARLRRLLDLDADPDAVDGVLARDPSLAPLVAQRPGLRVPGSVDGFELAVRAILGQQVSVAGARTLAGRIVAAYGEPLTEPDDVLERAFPSAEVMAEADLTGLGLTGARIRALRVLAAEVASGRLPLDPGADRTETRARLLALPGVGPWTAEYIAMRALADPDAWPESDLVLRRRVAARGASPDTWRPWRAYGAVHLWADAGSGRRRRPTDHHPTDGGVRMSTRPLDTSEIATATGRLAVVADDGVVVAAGFAPVEELVARLAVAQVPRGVRARRDLGPVTRAVRDYLAGDVDALDDVPVRQPGGAFTQEAWRVMREIPAGQTWTYSELALKAGRPSAVRAAGSACARNLVAAFVPCHRVVRTDGTLGGYYYGLPVKQWLLEHEAAAAGSRQS